jgi:hypothetical protein
VTVSHWKAWRVIVSLTLFVGLFPAFTLALQAEEAASDGPPPTPTAALAEAAVGNSPLMFVQNVGQFADEAAYHIPASGRSISLTEDGIWVALQQATAAPERDRLAEDPVAAVGRDEEPSGAVRLKLSFPGANPHPVIEPMERLNTHLSYFIGSDPDQWHADVPVYNGVRYVDLYPGIDLEVTGGDGAWDWTLAADAGANLADVRLRVEGADDVALTPGGRALSLQTAVGTFSLPLLGLAGPGADAATAPAMEAGKVRAPFAAGDDTTAPIETADNPNSLLYATFLGGSDHDRGYGIAVDASGNVYVTGWTYSSDFPTTASAYDDEWSGHGDAFVVKLNASGTDLTYPTFLGGDWGEYGRHIAVDASGNAYVAGFTYSDDFPTTASPYDASFNGGICDAFVVKLNASGTDLTYATFLGGSSDDYGYGIAVDASGNIYVTGETSSIDFPTTASANDASFNGYIDAFVVKLNASEAELTYATFLGERL